MLGVGKRRYQIAHSTAPIAIAYKKRTLNSFTISTFSSLSLAPFATMAEYKQPVGTQPRVCVFTCLPNRLERLTCSSDAMSLFLRVSQGVAPMQVLGGNRNAKNCPVGSDGKRDWSHGLCDCFGSCGTCTLIQHSYLYVSNQLSNHLSVGCMSIWCPCIVYSKNKQRLRNLKTHGTPLPGGGDTCDGDCCLYCGLGLFGLGWVLQVCSDVDMMHTVHGPLICWPLHRLALVAMFAIAMAFVGAHLATAAARGAAVRVLSHRNTVRLSWKRTVFK